MNINTTSINDIEYALAKLKSVETEEVIFIGGEKNKGKNDQISNYFRSKIGPAETVLKDLLDFMKQSCTFEQVFIKNIKKT